MHKIMSLYPSPMHKKAKKKKKKKKQKKKEKKRNETLKRNDI